MLGLAGKGCEISNQFLKHLIDLKDYLVTNLKKEI